MLSSETYRPGRAETSTDDGLGPGGNEDSSNMLTHACWGKADYGSGKVKNSEAKRAGRDSNPSPATLCEALDKLRPH